MTSSHRLHVPSSMHSRQNRLLIHFSSNHCLSLSFEACVGQGSPHSMVQTELLWCTHGLSEAVLFGAELEAPGKAAGERRWRESRVPGAHSRSMGPSSWRWTRTSVIRGASHLGSGSVLWKPEPFITELNTHQSSDFGGVGILKAAMGTCSRPVW